MKAILALDQGTTSSRALVFDASGAVLAAARKEFGQIFPRPGWVEHDPEEIWATQRAVALEAIGRAGMQARDIAAIGITNQRETTIVWERSSGRPVCNAIVWQDRRTAAACDALREQGLETRITEKTGLVLDAYFSGTKLAWILDHVPGARSAAEAGRLAFGTVDSWLIWKLTGGGAHVTDPTNASRTLLFDIHRGAWDAGLLETFAIPPQVLPAVRPSIGPVGHTDPRVLGAALPIAGIAGDQQAALFGQGCLSPGMVKNTYGTGCFMLMHTGTHPVRSRARLVTTAACHAAGLREYALEGSVFVAGAVVQWLRDALGIIGSAGEVEQLAASVPDNGGVYLVPAFAGLGSPHWDPYARGMIIGLTRGTGKAHIARAALEAIAFQTVDVLAAMESDSGISVKELRVDGGGARNDALMQFQADLLGVPVLRPANHETTALGAALLAGLGSGYWEDARALAGEWRAERVFEPGMERSRVEALVAGWHRAVERARHWEDFTPAAS